MAKTYKIRMKALAMGPNGQYLAEKTYDVPKKLRDQFVNGGYAEDVAVPKPEKDPEPDSGKGNEGNEGDSGPADNK